MASSGKKKTTMAKLNRESKLRERRLDKQARKDARKYGPPASEEPVELLDGENELDGTDQPDNEDPALATVAGPPADG
jgi:hypothetical protein